MEELQEMKETKKHPLIKLCECGSCKPPSALGDFFGVDRMFEALQMHQPESIFSCLQASDSPSSVLHTVLPSNAHTLHYHVLRALKNSVEEITQSCHHGDSEKWFGYHRILFQSSYGNPDFTAFHPIQAPDSFREWREYMGFEKRDTELEQAEEKARLAMIERDSSSGGKTKKKKEKGKGKKRKKDEAEDEEKVQSHASDVTLYPLRDRSTGKGLSLVSLFKNLILAPLRLPAPNGSYAEAVGGSADGLDQLARPTTFRFLSRRR